jgi:IS1 family transposase
MNRLSRDKRIQILACLCEGMSIRSTSRICEVSKDTIAKFVNELGMACLRHHDRTVLKVQSKRLQLDEIWAFVGCKQRNLPEEPSERGDCVGDVYTFTALDADTKLIVSYVIGQRSQHNTQQFVLDLRSRVATECPQITVDGFPAYPQAIGHAFKGQVDFAALIKLFTTEARHEARYSPPAMMGTKVISTMGNPDKKHISTAYVERANLTQRMHMRRFTRLTNAHSKKLQNHIAAQGMYFTFYNFVRLHGTLRTTPAMAAGLTDHIWELGEVVDILATREPKAKAVWSVKGWLDADKLARKQAAFEERMRRARKYRGNNSN